RPACGRRLAGAARARPARGRRPRRGAGGPAARRRLQAQRRRARGRCAAPDRARALRRLDAAAMNVLHDALAGLLASFAWPWWLLAAPVPWLVRVLLPPARDATPALRVPWGGRLHGFAGGARRPGVHGMPWLAWLAWTLLCVAAARPQVPGEAVQPPVSGRDLMLAVDLSGSMGEEDMRLGGRVVDRLTAAKAVLSDFLDRREGDRVGLIVFGQRAYVLSPLTLDRESVRGQLLDSVVGLAGRETALGDAIGLAVKRLRGQPAGQRVLVLLTDGVNTAGMLDPDKAAELAREHGERSLARSDARQRGRPGGPRNRAGGRHRPGGEAAARAAGRAAGPGAADRRGQHRRPARPGQGRRAGARTRRAHPCGGLWRRPAGPVRAAHARPHGRDRRGSAAAHRNGHRRPRVPRPRRPGAGGDLRRDRPARTGRAPRTGAAAAGGALPLAARRGAAAGPAGHLAAAAPPASQRRSGRGGAMTDALSRLQFMRPAWLWARLALPLLAAWWYRQRRRAGVWQRHVDPHLLPHLVEPGGSGAGRVGLGVRLLAFALAVFALAGPG